MLPFLHRRHTWPVVSPDAMRQRARILVIDDEPFDPYLKLFQDHGYNIEQWHDVDNLAALEEGAYDLIILDIAGVGGSISSEEGLGVLKHIRHSNPAQLIIAWSDKDFSLKYLEFLVLADISLSKSSDYVDFKSTIDDLLEKRFSLAFYITRIRELARAHIEDGAKLRAAAERAIERRDTAPLEKYLNGVTIDADTMSLILKVAKTAIEFSERHHGG